jgi:hypothetical protein
MWFYVVFNICAAIFLYWLVRVPKKIKKLPPPIPEPSPPSRQRQEKTEQSAETDPDETEAFRLALAKMKVLVDEGKFVDSIRSKMSKSTAERSDCEM